MAELEAWEDVGERKQAAAPLLRHVLDFGDDFFSEGPGLDARSNDDDELGGATTAASFFGFTPQQPHPTAVSVKGRRSSLLGLAHPAAGSAADPFSSTLIVDPVEAAAWHPDEGYALRSMKSLQLAEGIMCLPGSPGDLATATGGAMLSSAPDCWPGADTGRTRRYTCFGDGGKPCKTKGPAVICASRPIRRRAHFETPQPEDQARDTRRSKSCDMATVSVEEELGAMPEIPLEVCTRTGSMALLSGDNNMEGLHSKMGLWEAGAMEEPTNRNQRPTAVLLQNRTRGRVGMDFGEVEHSPDSIRQHTRPVGLLQTSKSCCVLPSLARPATPERAGTGAQSYSGGTKVSFSTDSLLNPDPGVPSVPMGTPFSRQMTITQQEGMVEASAAAAMARHGLGRQGSVLSQRLSSVGSVGGQSIARQSSVLSPQPSMGSFMGGQGLARQSSVTSVGGVAANGLAKQASTLSQRLSVGSMGDNQGLARQGSVVLPQLPGHSLSRQSSVVSPVGSMGGHSISRQSSVVSPQPPAAGMGGQGLSRQSSVVSPVGGMGGQGQLRQNSMSPSPPATEPEGHVRRAPRARPSRLSCASQVSAMPLSEG